MAAVVDQAQPVVDEAAEKGHTVMRRVARQIGLVVGDHRDVDLTRHEHAAHREHGGAGLLDQVGLEVGDVLDDDRVRQCDARFRRGPEAQRRQRNHRAAVDG